MDKNNPVEDEAGYGEAEYQLPLDNYEPLDFDRTVPRQLENTFEQDFEKELEELEDLDNEDGTDLGEDEPAYEPDSSEFEDG